MDFDSAIKRYRRLAERYNQGQLTSEQFEQAVDQLAITDEQGNLWQIGIKSGKWYRFEDADQHWVEDKPRPHRPPDPQLTPEVKQKPPLLNVVGIILVVGVLLSCLVGAVYFSVGNWDQIGDAFSRDNSGGNQEKERQETDPQDDLVTDTPIVDPSGLGPTQAPTQTPSPQPTPSQPEPTKPTQVEPQVWTLLSGNDFTSTPNLSGVWQSVPDRDWEWEFLNYAGKSSLYLQFTGEQEFIYNQNLQSAWEVESGLLELDLALPEQDAQVFLICRLQEETGDHYALKITNSRWAIISVIAGEETILAEGKPSATFSARNPERFRLECSGSTLTAYNEKGQLALVSVQDGLDLGGLAVRFSAGSGIGRIYLASENARLLTEESVGTLLDVVRLETFAVSLTQPWRIHQPMTEDDYQGQGLVSVGIRVEIFSEPSVDLKVEDIYLQQHGTRIYALGFVPESAVDPNPLELPVTIQPGRAAAGDVYFNQISEQELSAGWLLVIDLTSQGLGVAQFQIPDD